MYRSDRIIIRYFACFRNRFFPEISFSNLYRRTFYQVFRIFVKSSNLKNQGFFQNDLIIFRFYRHGIQENLCHFLCFRFSNQLTFACPFMATFESVARVASEAVEMTATRATDFLPHHKKWMQNGRRSIRPAGSGNRCRCPQGLVSWQRSAYCKQLPVPYPKSI